MPRKHTRGAKVQFYSFFKAALGGGEWLTSRPGCLTPGKEPQYPLNKRLGEPHSQSG